MSAAKQPGIGTIGWTDLTVDDAPRVRDFYAAVVGWQPAEVDMGGYADYTMAAPGTGQPTAGVCHRRGTNADLPAQWIVYVVVADLDASLERCTALGGAVLSAPRGAGGGRYAVIRDPAGAVCALYQSA